MRLPYLQIYRSRGRWFGYYRRGGARVRLEGEPGSPEFLAAYQRAHAAYTATPAPPPDAGTLAALIRAYRASPEWAALAPATRRDYDKALAPLLDRFGHCIVRTLRREHVLAIRDGYARNAAGVATPRQANRMVAVLRLLLSWAVDRGWRADNPALRPRMLKTGPGWRAWTRDEVARFLAHASPEMRLACLLALCTGQRGEDQIALRWSAVSGGEIRITQGKTGTALTLPIHPALREAIASAPRSAVTVLTRPDGKPWGLDHFRHAAGDAIRAAGLSGVVWHGLRRTAAEWLAEAGATAHQIAAVTGHKTLAMVEHYTRRAEQRGRARAALRRLKVPGAAPVAAEPDGTPGNPAA